MIYLNDISLGSVLKELNLWCMKNLQSTPGIEEAALANS